MRKLRGKVLLIVALALLQSGCLKKDLDTFMVGLDDIVERWHATDDTAMVTAKITLAPVVLQLQGIKQELKNLPRPECCAAMVETLDSSMDFRILAYQAFMASNMDFIVKSYFDTSDMLMGNFETDKAAFDEDPMVACKYQPIVEK